MSEVQRFDDGNLPPVGTKVRYLAGRDYITNSLTGEIGYIKPLRPENIGLSMNRKVLGWTKNKDDKFATNVIASWEVIEAASPLESLDDDQRKALAEQAYEAAKSHGYCEETKKVLTSLGLPTEHLGAKRRKVTVELEVEEQEGFSFHENNMVMRFNDNGSGKVKILTAREVDVDW